MDLRRFGHDGYDCWEVRLSYFAALAVAEVFLNNIWHEKAK